MLYHVTTLTTFHQLLRSHTKTNDGLGDCLASKNLNNSLNRCELKGSVADKNLWILTEERPKNDVVEIILRKFSKDYKKNIQISEINVKPIIMNKKFEFRYIVEGVKLEDVNEIHLKIISGAEGSFVDFLVFNQNNEPTNEDSPIYIIEETKTNPSESRNVAVFQRTSKFVFLELFKNNSNAEKIMLYSIRLEYNTLPPTFIFGIKAMKTLGVLIIGLKEAENGNNEAFETLDELIEFKNSIATKRADNTPLSIHKTDQSGVYRISGKLEKSGAFSHDPNMGAITLLSKLIKKLDPNTKKIIVFNHGLTQNMVEHSENKFIKIASVLGIELEGLTLQTPQVDGEYWKYNNKGEKIVSIFTHLLLQYKGVKIIYENHAGCEQGYFKFPDGKLKSIKKKTGKPDLILIEEKEKIIYLIEAEMAINAEQPQKGVNQLFKFDEVEQGFCSSYTGHVFKRYVILYGDKIPKNTDKIILQIKTNGEIICYDSCPKFIKNFIEEMSL
jgi:hypothetical protein